jgi:phage FluMu protein Com
MIRCPKCKSNLAVPDRQDAEIVVQCPRCRTEVELCAVPEEVSDRGERRRSFAGGSTSRSSSDVKSNVVRRRYYSRTRLPKNVAPTKVRRRRRKRKTKFTRADFVKVIVGGLMAFPVAQLILWWGFAKDPMQLGPQVASAVPFVVPRAFRGGEQMPLAEPTKYVANPESSLLQGKPFDFVRPQTKGNSTSIQRGMPRQRILPNRVESEPVPADGDNRDQ